MGEMKQATSQDYEDLQRCLSIIVTNAMLVPDPSMQGATDLYGVPLDDIADAGELLERLTKKQFEDAPAMRVIDGCNHSKSRMIEWVENGACPICLTADAGMSREAACNARNDLSTARTIEQLTEMIRQEIIQLRQWAIESRAGGWTTHQVDPMRQRADYLEEQLAQITRKL